ncbi:MAG: hypothetical protein ACRYGP_17450 [Janthinobacterium lividum]
MFGSRPPPYPSPEAAPLAPGNYDPCILCSAVREALWKIAGGVQAQHVYFGKRQVVYHAANVKELRIELRKLEAECEQSRGQGGAVQAGPQIPNGMFGFPFGPRRF